MSGANPGYWRRLVRQLTSDTTELDAEDLCRRVEQSDARRANPKLIEDDYLSEVARAVFERIGKAVPVQVVGGLSIAQAKSLAKAGLRAFVISGNMGLPDGNARYNLPPAEIQRLVAGFIAEVSGR